MLSEHLTRRRLLAGGLVLAGAGLVSGCGVPSLPWQQLSRVHRIALLAPSAPASSATDVSTTAFREGLRDLGYVEGQNLRIDERRFSGADRVAEPAAELVRLDPEAILVPSAVDARTVQAVTTTIPIVSAGNGDLVASGVVASHARPGGNVTGLSSPFLGGRQLQIFKEAVPAFSRVALLFDTTTGTYERDSAREPFIAAARALGLELHFVGVGAAADLESAFAAMIRERADSVLVLNGPVATTNQALLAELAVQHRLPSMWQRSDAVSRGALIGYGANGADLFRRAATFVDKILKGAHPGDLPVEQPTKFDLAINLRTATSLGLTIPQPIVAQATELIQ